MILLCCVCVCVCGREEVTYGPQQGIHQPTNSRSCPCGVRWFWPYPRIIIQRLRNAPTALLLLQVVRCWSFGEEEAQENLVSHTIGLQALLVEQGLRSTLTGTVPLCPLRAAFFGFFRYRNPHLAVYTHVRSEIGKRRDDSV